MKLGGLVDARLALGSGIAALFSSVSFLLFFSSYERDTTTLHTTARHSIALHGVTFGFLLPFQSDGLH
jgi:hypothetical protein